MTADAAQRERVWTPGGAALIAASFGALAVALWLLPATVRIVEWPASGPERIALFGSLESLVALMAGAIILAGCTIVWDRKQPSGRPIAQRIAPLCLLWFWSLPFLPWLPDRVPLLLLFSGPVRWIVAAVTVAALAHGNVTTWPSFVKSWRPDRRTAFASSLAVYLLFGALSARALGPGGDEPHYLIIAHSLLADGDLQIENNHLQGDYRAFFGAELRPDYLTRGQNDEIYSIHAPGLPVLLLPVYALAGYAGSLVLLCLMAALTALAIFDLADRVAGRRAAWLTWLGVCFSVPFIPHAWLLFPEMPGALLVAWGALWMWQADRLQATGFRLQATGCRLQATGFRLQAAGYRLQARWAWRGAALGFLPWLHTKFIVFLAIFVAGLVLRLRHRWRLAFWFLLPIAISMGAWLLSFYVIYGTINPEAPYGDYTRLFVLLENIPRGLLGLSFDQKFGLFIYSPLYLVSFLGAWRLLKRDDARYLGVLLLLVTAAFVGSTTRLYMWWGGSSAPARFLVPVLPCLAPMVAVGIAAMTRPLGRVLLTIWIAFGTALAVAGGLFPERLYLFSNQHGRGRLVELMEAGAPLADTLPTYTNEDWVTPLVALLPWLGAALLGIIAMILVARRVQRAGALGIGVAGVLTFLVVAGALTARPSAEAREAAAERGALDLLWAYEGERHRAFGYQELAHLPPPAFLAASARTSSRLPSGPLSLPPGSYEARVWFNGTMAREGEVVVSASPTAVFGRATGRLSNPAVVPFSLPVPSTVQVQVPDAGLASVVRQIDITPGHVVPASERPAIDPRAVESIPNWPGGYLVYADQHAYPEGGVFWTRGTDTASVLVAPGGASRLALTLHLGPRSGDVRVTVAGEEYVASVAANSISHIEAPVPEGLSLVPITVQSPGEFRPSDVDPSSGDMRRLGCQVRVELR